MNLSDLDHRLKSLAPPTSRSVKFSSRKCGGFTEPVIHHVELHRLNQHSTSESLGPCEFQETPFIV